MQLTGYILPNIPIQLVDIEAWSEQEIFHKLGQPEKENVVILSGQDTDPSATVYLIELVMISSIDPQWL